MSCAGEEEKREPLTSLRAKANIGRVATGGLLITRYSIHLHNLTVSLIADLSRHTIGHQASAFAVARDSCYRDLTRDCDCDSNLTTLVTCASWSSLSNPLANADVLKHSQLPVTLRYGITMALVAIRILSFQLT